MHDYVEVPNSDAETAQLVDALTRTCGCGCTLVDGDLICSSRHCGAVRMLRDQRFVLGLCFARTLREQLVLEEWCRNESRARTTMPESAPNEVAL